MLDLTMMKKGQKEGLSVALIIGAILVMMLIYIIVMPPEVRDDLLNENNSVSSTSNIEKQDLLSEVPGLVSSETESKTAHAMPSVNIYLKDDV